MNHLSKAINMILRGDVNKFKNILEEALRDRAALFLEAAYKEESENILKNIEIIKENLKNPILEIKETQEFTVPSVHHTKDGKTITLTEEQVNSITKLYKSLNNSSKERLLKLLSESEDSINRIINLAKFERNKK
jgi:hypothetical protein